MSIIAKFVHCLYDNDDYRVALFQAENSQDIPKGYEKNNGISKEKSFIATGYFPMNKKIYLDLSGKWKNNKYGFSFEVQSYEEKIYDTEEGIIAYLSSGLVKGVGENIAKKIVEIFGKETIKVLENEPELLLQVKGISRNKLEQLVDSYSETKSVREIINYLAPFGVSPSKCVKIKKEFGKDSMNILTTNPYLLCNLKGFNFEVVDEIASKTDCKLNEPLRIEGCIKFLLEQHSLQGHCCYPQRNLISESHKVLNKGRKNIVCSYKDITKVFCQMAQNKTLKGDRGYAYFSKIYENEVNTAKSIYVRLTNKKLQLKKEDCYKNFHYDFDDEKEILKILEKIEKEENFKLAEKQKEAVFMALKENFSIITGGPGVGKTTVLKFLLKVYKELTNKSDILLLAPTGRASRRMGESIDNEYPSSTIHSALKISGSEDEILIGEILTYSLVIIDEASMCDAAIFALLMSNIMKYTKVVLLGDPEQLPSVGAGNVLFELLSNKNIPRVELDVIFRQGNNSLIVANSKKISTGDTNLSYGDDFVFYPEIGAENTARKVVEVFEEEYKKVKNLDDIQILSPMRKAGIQAGTTELNKEIQKRINPSSPAKKEISRHGVVFREGDKIIQTQNTKSVSNGDIGYIIGISADKKISIKFSNTTLDYELPEMDNVELAYAITIHKFQGSECDTCIIPIIKDFGVMLKRNITYTGITRGKKKIILVGEQKAIVDSIKNNDIQKRNTFLSDRIDEFFNKNAKAEKGQQLSLFNN